MLRILVRNRISFFFQFQFSNDFEWWFSFDLNWIDELSISDFVSLFGRPNCSRTSAHTMYKICLKISRLFLKFWTIAISYSMFQQSKLTHRMLNWHQTDRPSATINYNLSPTTILPRDLITFQLSHIATASQNIAPILEI